MTDSWSSFISWAWVPILAFFLLLPVVILTFPAQQRRRAALKAALAGTRALMAKHGIMGLELRTASGGQFLIRHLSPHTRELRARRETAIVRSGDGAFDHRYEFQCDDSELVAWLGRSDAARRHVDALLRDFPYRMLVLEGARLRVMARIDVQDLETLATAARHLLALAALLPAGLAPSPGTTDLDQLVTRLRWAASITVVLALILGTTLYVDAMLRPFPQHAAPFVVFSLGVLAGLPLVWALRRQVNRWLSASSRAPTLRSEMGWSLYGSILALTAMAAQQINLRIPASPVYVEETGARRVPGESRVRLGPVGQGAIPVSAWDVDPAYARRIGEMNHRGLARVRVEWRYGRLGQPLILREPELIRAP